MLSAICRFGGLKVWGFECQSFLEGFTLEALKVRGFEFSVLGQG